MNSGTTLCKVECRLYQVRVGTNWSVDVTSMTAIFSNMECLKWSNESKLPASAKQNLVVMRQTSIIHTKAREHADRQAIVTLLNRLNPQFLHPLAKPALAGIELRRLIFVGKVEKSKTAFIALSLLLTSNKL